MSVTVLFRRMDGGVPSLTHGLKWLDQETSSSHANSNKRENQVPHKNARHIFWTKSFDTRIGASHAIIVLLRSSVAGLIPNFL